MHPASQAIRPGAAGAEGFTTTTQSFEFRWLSFLMPRAFAVYPCAAGGCWGVVRTRAESPERGTTTMSRAAHRSLSVAVLIQRDCRP